jgi:glycosyltransferase involved in cell wall biosynthesis
MKLSIIVPVYNVEEYILECVQSLCNQTLKDIEIIVVDDGSTDNSINIVKEFKDKRIKIVTQQNGGLSSARNTGMKVAKGEYITFVDSDDYIGIKTAYEEMYNIAIRENSDIVAGNCLWYYSEEKKYKMDRKMTSFCKSPMQSEEFFIQCLKTKRVYVPVWLNIYKRNLLIDNNLYFKQGIYHEDEEFTPRVLLMAELVSIYNKEFYIYRQRENSITNSSKLNMKRGFDVLRISLELKKLADNINNDELKVEFKNYLCYIALDAIYKYKMKNIDCNVKKMINETSNTLPRKIKSYALQIDERLYFTLETGLRILKNPQNSHKSNSV